MILSSNMIRIHDAFGMKETFDIFAESGIEGIDFNCDVSEYHTEEHDEHFYTDLKNYAAKKGIAICQAHAPFPSGFVDEEKTEKRFWDIVCAMKNTSYLGAPMIVVHPLSHLDISTEESYEKGVQLNLDFYRRLIPYAEQYGIKIAIENIGYAVTADPAGLIRLLDALNHPVFTVCFDVGHCLLCGFDPADSIRMIGDRLVDGCTHIHDNMGNCDDHTLPYYGKIDWESVMKALADIDYRGELNYEASGFIKDIPVQLRPDGFKYMAKVGHYLISRFEFYKNN